MKLKEVLSLTSIFLNTLLFHIVTVCNADGGHCLWYGECNINEYNKTQNCPFSGPAKPLNELTGRKLFSKLCPYMFPNYLNIPNTCCDIAQLQTLQELMWEKTVHFARCPNCFDNWKKHICEFTCSPIQSTFMNVTEMKKKNDSTPYISEIDVFITKEYLEGTYNSCKRVPELVTGEFVMNMICTEYGARECNAQRWFEAMGNANRWPKYVPFQIRYRESNDKNGLFTPINPAITPCHQPLNSEVSACGCVVCEESCPVLPTPSPPPQPFTVFGFDGISIVMTIIFVIGSTLFILSAMCCHKQKQTDATSPTDPSKNRNTNKFTAIERLREIIDRYSQQLFFTIGYYCGKMPWIVLIIGNICIMFFYIGIPLISIISSLCEMSVPLNSREQLERMYFENCFHSDHRREEIIISSVGLPNIVHNTSQGQRIFGPVFNVTFLRKVQELQEEIKKLTTINNVTLYDVCYKHHRSKYTNDAAIEQCQILSIWNYYNRKEFIETNGQYLDDFMECTRNPSSCPTRYAPPVQPELILGGYLPFAESSQNPPYERATAIIITIFVMNRPYYGQEVNQVIEWERKFISFMKNWTSPEFLPSYMEVAFRSEISSIDEVHLGFQSELPIIAGSYVAMFTYTVIALGQFKSYKRLLIDSSIVLGLSGIFITLVSLASSVGLFATLEIPATMMLLINVVLLVLAIGIGNIFLLVKTHQRECRRPSESTADHTGRILGKVGPSMLLTCVTESSCFYLGTLSHLPVVKIFGLYAGTALLFNFLLQITCFVSVISLDARRKSNRQFDICCCTRGAEHNTDRDVVGIFDTIVKHIYTLLLSKTWSRASVMVIFFGWFCTSITVVSHIEMGLDEKLIFTEDNFLVKYQASRNNYSSIGPPVYFVVVPKFDWDFIDSEFDLDFTDTETQNLICSGINCNSDSVTTQIYIASQYPNQTYIAKPPSSWIDDYFQWSRMNCRRPFDRWFCTNRFLGDFEECKMNMEKYTRPTAVDFRKYFPLFMNDNPNMNCDTFGYVSDHHSVLFFINGITHLSTFYGMYFKTYYTVLKTPADHLEAIKAAKIISNNITRMLLRNFKSGTKVFAYSDFHASHGQYFTIWYDTLWYLGISLLVIFIVTFVLLGFDIISSFIILLTTTMILVDLMGLMYWWHIPLNAMSLINLITAVGLSVEFCSHLVYSFAKSVYGTRIERIQDIFMDMADYFCSGVILTKFVAIFVLAFFKFQLLHLFHFTMYLGTFVIGAVHGLIFLPVLLSYIGPPKNRLKHAMHKRAVELNIADPPRRRANNMHKANPLTAPTNTIIEETRL